MILLQAELAYGKIRILHFLYRVDLWLFPPLVFYFTFITAARHFPSHPMALNTSLSIAFNAAALALFMLRPPKRRTAHWVQ